MQTHASPLTRRRFLHASALGWGGLHAGIFAQSNDKPLVSAAHPGGNIQVGHASGDRLYLSPDLRDTQKGKVWFYWNFRALNTSPIEVVFSRRDNIGFNGPAFSQDGGKTWTWMGREVVTEAEHPDQKGKTIWSFKVPATPPGSDVRYAFCPQYQESHLRDWLKRHEGDKNLSLEEFTKSREGRSVECLKVASPDAPPPKKSIVLIARQHCCEVMGSYVLEGFLTAALGQDETGQRLRQGWEFFTVPFMDKDGVEKGDQGKNRHPHDHNRDYNETPIYPEVAALIKKVTQERDQVVAFLDLHCPAVHGLWDNRVYLVGSPDPQFAARQAAFVQSLIHTQTGKIRLRPDELLAFGTAWNVSTNFSAGKNASAWARESLPDAALVTTVEIPYANSRGVPVTAESARELGRDFAVALLHHLEETDNKG